MSETNLKEQSSGEMIKANNQMNLRELFRKVDFVIPLMIGLLFFWFCIHSDIRHKTFIDKHNGHESLTLIGFGIFMVSILFSRARWKFVYGTKEYKEKVRNHIISRRYKNRAEISRGHMIWGSTLSCAAMIILIFVTLIENLLYHQYLNVFILLGIEAFFCFIFYLITRK